MSTKRQNQVAQLVKSNMSAVLMNQGYEIYGEALVTVTNVIVSPDLGQAKIYFSVYNADDKEVILNNLRKFTKPLSKELAHRMRNHIRRIPAFFYYLDDTLDEMYKLNNLFDEM